MNLITFCAPMAISPRHIAVAIYDGTQTAANFARDPAAGEGVLQVRRIPPSYSPPFCYSLPASASPLPAALRDARAGPVPPAFVHARASHPVGLPSAFCLPSDSSVTPL